MSSITFNIPTNAVTVNNGLSKSGSNVHLGGLLTGDTAIISDGSSPAKEFIFGNLGQGQRFNKFGVYVTGSTGLQEFDWTNGDNNLNLLLYGSSNFISLGATNNSNNNNSNLLVNQTYLSMGTTNGTTSDIGQLTTTGGGVQILVVDGASSISNEVDVTLSHALLRYNQTSAGNSSVVATNNDLNLYFQNQSSGDDSGILLTDADIQVSSANPLFAGMVYSDDFSANYTNRSLADKGYVLAQVSDVRVKENILPIESSLLKINALRPVEFDFIKTKEHKIGFIAQELEQVFPELIVSDDGEYLKIKESQLIPYLVKAIQELTKKVETLEEKLNTK